MTYRPRRRSASPSRQELPLAATTLVHNPAHDDGVDVTVEFNASVFGTRFDEWTRSHQRRLLRQRTSHWLNSQFHRLHVDNPHMRSCFRPMPLSFRDCVASVWQWHNDTMNIHTHALAAVIYSLLGYFAIGQLREEGATDHESMVYALMCAAFVFAWSSSAVYHTMRAHSDSVFTCTLICDLWGIVFTLATCNFITIKMELTCFPHQAWLWQITNAVTALVNLAIVPIFMRVQEVNVLWSSIRTSSVRTVIWMSYTAYGILAHYNRLSLTGAINETTLKGLLLTYFVSAVALLIRNVKLPEVFAHGKYDLIGASHQIFHVVVALAPIPLFVSYFNEIRRGSFMNLCQQ